MLYGYRLLRFSIQPIPQELALYLFYKRLCTEHAFGPKYMYKILFSKVKFHHHPASP